MLYNSNYNYIQVYIEYDRQYFCRIWWSNQFYTYDMTVIKRRIENYIYIDLLVLKKRKFEKEDEKEEENYTKEKKNRIK